MTGLFERWRDGHRMERVVDHGDGTGTRTLYRPDGTIDTIEELTGLPIPADTEPEPDPLAILANLPPAQAEALVRLGVGLAQDAGALWDALEQIAPTNTARTSIDIITHHALEAGLALTEPGEPEP